MSLTEEGILANTQLLEELFIDSDLKIPKWASIYRYERGAQWVDIAIATVAKYTPRATVYDIIEAEDEDDPYFAEHVRLISTLWQDYDYLISPERNLLVHPEVRDWRLQLRQHLATLLELQGRIMTDDDRSFSWVHPHFWDPKERPAVLSVLTVEEDYWSEFDGTFVPGSDHVGISGIVLLADHTVRKLRVETDLSELIHGAVMKVNRAW